METPDDDRDDAADDAKPAPVPKWLSLTSWLEAKIDLTVFGLGYVYLQEATDAAVKEWASAGQKGWDRPLATAKLFAAYIDHGDDPSFPARGAGWQKWESWLAGGVKNKVVRRISDGIIRFMQHVGDESAAPN